MRHSLTFVLTVALWLSSEPAMAAQSGERSPFDSNPDCLDRRAPSDKCVIDDGLPPQPRHIRRPVAVQPPPPRPPPAAPESQLRR